MANDMGFQVDKAGFPMVWVGAINAYIHWLPVTKIQFETYICARPEASFDESWYNEVNALNPRVSPSGLTTKDSQRAFITGIKPGEAEKYAEWCGEVFAIPTKQEWFDAYKYLKSEAALVERNGNGQMGLPFLDYIPNLSSRARQLMEKTESISQMLSRDTGEERRLSDQMMMRYGVFEWVHNDNRLQKWAGAGQPRNGWGAPMNSIEKQVIVPTSADNRMPYFGFRLLRRI